MFYYVYVLQSLHCEKLYIGYSTNLIARLASHNKGKNKATRPYIPYKLIFYEAFLSKKDAEAREIYLKSGYGLRTIKTMLKTYLSKDE
jgi:putative endonuclease